MINPAETWVRIAKPSVDGIRRLGARAGIETVPGACLWLALVIIVVRTGGG
ncbi:MAG: hypothetical protein ABSA49_03940 [Rhizomicrobium sp.]|jgi:hypothetical protein